MEIVSALLTLLVFWWIGQIAGGVFLLAAAPTIAKIDTAIETQKRSDRRQRRLSQVVGVHHSTVTGKFVATFTHGDPEYITEAEFNELLERPEIELLG